MAKRKIHLKTEEAEIELPIRDSTEGPAAVEISALSKKLGYSSLDPGFVSTASCRSDITYIDGDQGLLRYRGYPIEQLAEQSSHLECCYLLLHGELPDKSQLAAFTHQIQTESKVPEGAWGLCQAFEPDAHPMAMLMASLSYLAAIHHSELDVFNLDYQQRMAVRLIAQTPTLAALGYRHRNAQEPIAPDPQLDYVSNFIHMMFGNRPDQLFVRALDVIMMLHADHEQNASTSTVRLSGSAENSPFAAVTAGVATLWGPSHGGANEAVIRMLEEIHASDVSPNDYVQRAKNKDGHTRLMGFGHRIYKNYDPRAKLIRQICYEMVETHGTHHPERALLETAMTLERLALEDDYFIERKLYPNVDFYSGIILKAMGIPLDMFTVIFAIARTAGWVAHWVEMMNDEDFRIGRPLQLYIGHKERNYTPIKTR